MQSLTETDIQGMTVSQRLDLIGQLWDSIPDSEEVPMPEWHRKELERRLADAGSSPERALPWEQVKARLQTKP